MSAPLPSIDGVTISQAELEQQCAVAERIRDILREQFPLRAEALAACLIVVASEAGHEGGVDCDRFMRFAVSLMTWAFDEGARIALKDKRQTS